jgi:hypothetical protein
MVVTWDAGKEPGIAALSYYSDTRVQVDGQWRFKTKIMARWDSETAPMVGQAQ